MGEAGNKNSGKVKQGQEQGEMREKIVGFLEGAFPVAVVIVAVIMIVAVVATLAPVVIIGKRGRHQNSGWGGGRCSEYRSQGAGVFFLRQGRQSGEDGCGKREQHNDNHRAAGRIMPDISWRAPAEFAGQICEDLSRSMDEVRKTCVLRAGETP